MSYADCADKDGKEMKPHAKAAKVAKERGSPARVGNRSKPQRRNAAKPQLKSRAESRGSRARTSTRAGNPAQIAPFFQIALRWTQRNCRERGRINGRKIR